MPRKTPEQRDQTRRAILDAAERCFAEQGYDRATLHQIASEASITVPTLYAYFGGKGALLRALEHRVGEKIPQLMDVLLPRGLTFAQKLELLIGHHLREVEAHHDRYRFILDARPPKALASRYTELLTEWLREHDTEGELRYDVGYSALVISATWGACFRVWANRGAPEGELVPLAPRIADTLLGGLVRT